MDEQMGKHEAKQITPPKKQQQRKHEKTKNKNQQNIMPMA